MAAGPTEFSLESVRQFMLSRDGRVTNHELVKQFKHWLTHPMEKDSARQRFKEYVNTLATIQQDNGEKYLVLKQRFFPQFDLQPSSSGGSPSMLDEIMASTSAFRPPPPQQFHPRRVLPPTPSEYGLPPPPMQFKGEAPADFGLPTQYYSPSHSQRGSYASNASDILHRQNSGSSVGRSQRHSSYHESPPSDYRAPPPTDYRAPPPYRPPPTQQPLYRPPPPAPSRQMSASSLPPSDLGLPLPSEYGLPSPRQGVFHPPSMLVPQQPHSLTHHPSLQHMYQQPSLEPPPLPRRNGFEEPPPVETHHAPPSVEIHHAPPPPPPANRESSPPPPLPSRPPPLSRKSSSENEDKENSSPMSTTEEEEMHSLRAANEKISVKERTKTFNRLASEVELRPQPGFSAVAVKRRNSRAAADRRSSSQHLRSDDDSQDSGSITTLDQTSKQWLIRAAQGDYHTLVKMLKDDPRLAKHKDFTNGYTALHWAAKHGNQDMVKLLAGHYSAQVNIKSHGGYTPLHLACMFGHQEVFDLLVKAYGADANIRDNSGKKPRQYIIMPDQGQMGLSLSNDTFRQLKDRRRNRRQAENNPGILRFGSLSVKVKKTTEAFNNYFSGGDRKSSWPSTDSLQSGGSNGDRDKMPPPKFAPIKKRKSKRSVDFGRTKSAPVTPTDPTPIKEHSDGSDSEYGFDSQWSGTPRI